MVLDIKKTDKSLFPTKPGPAIVEVPRFNFLAVRGQGDPNLEEGEYAAAVPALYAIAYTLKMSPRSGYAIPGFTDYVVPPLEGLWWQDGIDGFELGNKAAFSWISLIRLPDFIQENAVAWAVAAASAKKKDDFSKVKFFIYDEGLCVQSLHVGPYDTEPATVAAMDAYATDHGYICDFASGRHHHEIYLSDPRKTAPENLKTIIRHPIRKASSTS